MKRWSVFIVEAGIFGRILVKYRGFQKKVFIISGVIDNNPLKIGRKIGHIFICDIIKINKFIWEKNINIGL